MQRRTSAARLWADVPLAVRVESPVGEVTPGMTGPLSVVEEFAVENPFAWAILRSGRWPRGAVGELCGGGNRGIAVEK